MKLLTLTTILPALAFAQAQSIFDDWHPAVPGQDSRGPCPGLNALANHGILPRSGKNITIPDLVKGLGAGVNISAELATILGMGAIKTSDTPALQSFDLDDLGKHNLIEHDGSLSRKDIAFVEGTPTHKLDEDIFDDFMSYFNASASISLPVAAAARWGRMQSSRKDNSQFQYTPSGRFSSYSETAIYYLTLQNPATGTVPVEHLKVLFTEERLPYKEGWRPLVPVNGGSFSQTLLSLAISTPEEASDLVIPSM
ncbi:unnamed protein product [Periconia digitata]|uniref:Heme haloperoxidase family profile domain-containing protein n=1 Tax=Periconia digitata TaxID=1303443 RepID=A0A9W4XLG2_9PLEO|nr:unnamed protein product [Periconia digitata]